MVTPKAINGKPFYFDDWLTARLRTMNEDIQNRWKEGSLTTQIQKQLYEQTKLDEIYHSNRIEGNRLNYGETRNIIKRGGTIPDKPTIDQVETRNLMAALDFAQETAFDKSKAVTQNFVRQFHAVLMNDIRSDAGRYRNTENIIKGSRYKTLEVYLVPQYMTDLSDFLLSITAGKVQQTEFPIFSAAAAHACFVQIHPFADGNGRTARTLMNLILRRNGYPPSIILEEDRPRYIDALEHSWEKGDLSPLIELVHENIAERVDTADLLYSLRARLEMAEIRELQEEYEDWRRKMEHLKTVFEHSDDYLGNGAKSRNARVATYSEPSIEQYALLRSGDRVKRTSFFGIEINAFGKRSRYLFFFAPPLGPMKGQTPVALVISKYIASEDTYTSLYNLHRDGASVPDIFQIGYNLKERKFVTNGKDGLGCQKLPNLVLQFLDQVIERDFGS